MEDTNQSQLPSLPFQPTPDTDDALARKIAMRFRTDAPPTYIPPYDGVHEVYFDGTDYWLYVFANGVWTAQKLGVMGIRSQVFAGSGTFTAPAGVTTVYLTMVGGGGGGGGGDGNLARAGGGGGSGGWYMKRPFTVVPGNNYTVTIGAGGAAGTHGTPAMPDSGTQGGSGGTTSFDSVSVTGGSGGKHGNSVDGPGPGGLGGTPNGFTGDNASGEDGGSGASSPFGTGGENGEQASHTNPDDGDGFGQGGGGGYDDNPSVNGSVGAAGFVLVEW